MKPDLPRTREGGRERTGQPAARAGDTFRVIMDMGKFHGVIAATTLHRGRIPPFSSTPRQMLRAAGGVGPLWSTGREPLLQGHRTSPNQGLKPHFHWGCGRQH